MAPRLPRFLIITPPKTAHSKNNGQAATKQNAGKPRWDLLPFDALGKVAQVVTFGAVKYKPRDWERGRPWGDYLSAAQRHQAAFMNGEDDDEESHLPHLAHAITCLLFVLAYQLRGVGDDDRA